MKKNSNLLSFSSIVLHAELFEEGRRELDPHHEHTSGSAPVGPGAADWARRGRRWWWPAWRPGAAAAGDTARAARPAGQLHLVAVRQPGGAAAGRGRPGARGPRAPAAARAAGTAPARRPTGCRRQGAEVVGFCLVAGGPGAAARPGREVTGLADVARPRAAAGQPGARRRGPARARPRAGPALRLDPATLPGYQHRGRRPPGGRGGHRGRPGRTPAWPASPPRSPTASASSPSPPSTPTWSSRPPRRAAARRPASPVLSSRWLLDQLASLPGYDPARCGEHVASL